MPRVPLFQLSHLGGTFRGGFFINLHRQTPFFGTATPECPIEVAVLCCGGTREVDLRGRRVAFHLCGLSIDASPHREA